MESIAVAAFFLRSMPDCCDARVPTTSTFVTAASAGAAGAAGLVSCAIAMFAAISATATDTA